MAFPLNSGTGDVVGVYVPADPDAVQWGWVAPGGTPPVAKVRPGELLTVDTISHEGILADQGRDPVAFFGRYGIGRGELLDDTVSLAGSSRRHDPASDGPHVLTGPIWVEGAEPGDVVTVEVIHLALRVPYGVVSNRHGLGALPGEMPEPDPSTGRAIPVVCRFASVFWRDGGCYAVVHPPSDPRTNTRPAGGLPLPLRPFLGLVAVAPGDRPAHSVPPGPHGGNLDVRLLGMGSRLHLPVRVEGALVQVGDPHFAQGDGEVALTALEGPLRAVLRIELAKAAQPSWDLPFGETDDAWLLLGLHEDVDEAVRIATRAGIALVTERTGVDRATAYAWLSTAADLSVSQVVDEVKGVHLSVPKRWLRLET
ncbi:MAG TPA: acetamidase/formamidase family protein [Acidimicrobiales bacterium]|nr:acetamidase/formamidase family protein [Acidimicrobiales bacterium]